MTKAILFSLFFSVGAVAQEAQNQEPKLIGATLLGSQTFDVYETQDRDLVYKKRTEKTPVKEETPTFENIQERQARHEIAIGAGFFHTSKKALSFQQQNNQYPNGLWSFPGALTLRYNFHPPKEGLKRFTFSGEIISIWSDAGDRYYENSSGVSKGSASMNPFKNWAALADYDVLIFPWSRGGAQIISAGYALGHISAEQMTGPNPEPEPNKSSLEHFVTLRWRSISKKSELRDNYGSETDNRSQAYSFIGGRLSTHGSWKFEMGYVFPFGRAANPKRIIEK